MHSQRQGRAYALAWLIAFVVFAIFLPMPAAKSDPIRSIVDSSSSYGAASTARDPIYAPLGPPIEGSSGETSVGSLTAASNGNGLGGTASTSTTGTRTTGTPDASVNLNLGDLKDKPSNSVLIMLLLTLISVAPTLLIMMTSFTRIAVVLSLTRNALGLQTIPPNQVIVGLALFLSLFVMKPTLTQMNDQALQPLLKGEKTQAQAFEAAMVPMRNFMMKQTRKGELAMFMKASGQAQPRTPSDISMATLIPAFILSELKTAFIIGFVVFIPFLVIDIVVSSSLMSMRS